MGLIYWWARLAAPLAPVVNFFTHTRPFSTLLKALGGLAPEAPSPPSRLRRSRGGSATGEHPSGGPRTQASRRGALRDLPPSGWTPTTPRRTPTWDGKRLNIHAERSLSAPDAYCCGPTPSTTISLHTSPWRRSRYWSVQAPSSRSRPVHSVADVHCTISGCWIEPRRCGGKRCRVSGRIFGAACRSWVWSRVVCPPSGTNSSTSSPMMRMPKGSRIAPSCSANIWCARAMSPHAPSQGPRSWPLPAQGHHAHGRRDGGLEEDGPGIGRARCGLLRPRGILRVFERQVRDLDGAGERVLLPAVRAADDETLLVIDGFSCREQTEAATGRRPLHLAEVVRMALRAKTAAPPPSTDR